MDELFDDHGIYGEADALYTDDWGLVGRGRQPPVQGGLFAVTSSSCILTSSSCILTSSSCILRRRELGHAGVPRLQSGEVDCAAVGAFLDGWDLHSDVDGEFPPYTDCSSPIY